MHTIHWGKWIAGFLLMSLFISSFPAALLAGEIFTGGGTTGEEGDSAEGGSPGSGGGTVGEEGGGSTSELNQESSLQSEDAPEKSDDSEQTETQLSEPEVEIFSASSEEERPLQTGASSSQNQGSASIAFDGFEDIGLQTAGGTTGEEGGSATGNGGDVFLGGGSTGEESSEPAEAQNNSPATVASSGPVNDYCTYSHSMSVAEVKRAIVAGGFKRGVILRQIDASTGRGVVQNDTDCSFPVTMASYTLDNPTDEGFTEQTFFAATEHAVSQPHSTLELLVRLPSCNFQADYFYNVGYPQPAGSRLFPSESFLDSGYIVNREAAGGFACPPPVLDTGAGTLGEEGGVSVSGEVGTTGEEGENILATGAGTTGEEGGGSVSAVGTTGEENDAVLTTGGTTGEEGGHGLAAGGTVGEESGLATGGTTGEEDNALATVGTTGEEGELSTGGTTGEEGALATGGTTGEESDELSSGGTIGEEGAGSLATGGTTGEEGGGELSTGGTTGEEDGGLATGGTTGEEGGGELSTRGTTGEEGGGELSTGGTTGEESRGELSTGGTAGEEGGEGDDEEEEPVDMCTNIEGVQETVPSGLVRNTDGTCNAPTGGGGPVDMCTNLEGVQETVPSGLVRNTDGTCSVPSSGGSAVDQCTNIEGVQETVPAGLVRNVVDGSCVAPSGGGGGPVTVTTGGGGGGGGGAGSFPLIIANPSVTQTCEGIRVQWYTNQPARSRVVIGTQSVPAVPVNSPLLGYSTEIASTSLGTAHIFTFPVVPGVTYYFRPVSTVDGYSPVIGAEMSLATVENPNCFMGTGGPQLPACPFISDFLRRGEENNIDQVLRLQVFLKVREGIDVPFTGVFDDATEAGVKAFQEKYRADILDPWGPGTAPTGYVYILTKWKINQILCGEAVRPEVSPVSKAAAPQSKEGSKEGQFKEGVARQLDAEIASSTPDKPLIIGVGTSTPETTPTNTASVAHSVKDKSCTLFRGKNIVEDFILLLPRAICCALGL